MLRINHASTTHKPRIKYLIYINTINIKNENNINNVLSIPAFKEKAGSHLNKLIEIVINKEIQGVNFFTACKKQ